MKTSQQIRGLSINCLPIGEAHHPVVASPVLESHRLAQPLPIQQILRLNPQEKTTFTHWYPTLERQFSGSGSARLLFISIAY